MKQNLAEAPLQQDDPSTQTASSKLTPGDLAGRLDECALLLDIDGTLLDLAPAPREVWVPPGLATTLNRLIEKTSGALALVSGRSLNDIDLIFAPEQFPAVGGHGAEMRLSTESEAVATHAPPMDKELKRRLAAIAKLSPGILLEDKGYSLALHYRLAPHAEKAIYEAVSLIRADLPNALIEVMPGKCVCEIKHSGFNKASGVVELMSHEPFKGLRFSSATMSPTKACSPSCPILAGWHFRSAGARRASPVVSTNRATSGNGSHNLPVSKLRRDGDRRASSCCAMSAEACNPALFLCLDHASSSFGPNLVSFR